MELAITPIRIVFGLCLYGIRNPWWPRNILVPKCQNGQKVSYVFLVVSPRFALLIFSYKLLIISCGWVVFSTFTFLRLCSAFIACSWASFVNCVYNLDYIQICIQIYIQFGLYQWGLCLCCYPVNDHYKRDIMRVKGSQNDHKHVISLVCQN